MIRPAFRQLILALGSMLLAGSALATPGTLIRAAELKADAFVDAANLGNLTADTPLTVLEGKGGWSKIRTADGKTGWVRLLNVRIAAASSDGNALATLGNVVRTGTTQGAATTGVKGLSKEDLAKAQPNLREVAKLDGFRARPADINRFATSRKLTAREIAELNP